MKIASALGALAFLCAGPVLAQTNTTAAQSANTSIINVRTGGNTATPASESIHYSGQTNTPDVAGMLMSGANPCLVGAGVSVATMGTGVGMSWGHDSEACERRQDAAAFYSVGVGTHNPMFINVALDRLCDGEKNRHALEAEGYICPADRPKGTPAPVLQINAPAPPSTPTRPDWCYTVGPKEWTANTRKACS